MPHPVQDTPSVWRQRWASIVASLVHLFWVAVIYLASELIIWGLSRTLHPVGLEFFASIVGMVLVFFISTAVCLIWRTTHRVHGHWIRAKVNFINAHLGLGFPVPIIMVHQGQSLAGRDIARIIGTFVATNLVSWISVFALSAAALSGVASLIPASFKQPLTPRSKESSPRATAKSSHGGGDSLDGLPTLTDLEQPSAPSRQRSAWALLETYHPILLSLSGVFIIGVPATVAAQDERFVDAFSMCFIWISSVTAQRSLRTSRIMASNPGWKRTLTTMINPVLMTVLLMIAYTRLKALAFGPHGLTHVLQTFSSGTPLYSLWTAAASGVEIPGNPSRWFGAGDAALSILECGILTWGLKLSECRRQIFSLAGFVTILLCTAAAAGNVFLSVAMGRAMGLGPAEVLSFAARSTTLALAKPAVEAVGGNIVVNATLVVSNGVLGQLMYPLVLRRLSSLSLSSSSSSSSSSSYSSPSPSSSSSSSSPSPSSSSSSSISSAVASSQGGGIKQVSSQDSDSPVTIAIGIAIGINGAAMGVAYLYENKSRAAPYAALAMAVFGVMTVVFTTVEPFRSVVVSLAGR